MSGPRDPNDTFLGVTMHNDPFSLLGLPRQPVGDAEVLQALGKRMSQIASHARAQTPEANEIRLALHAAAAQLLDPQLQQILLAQGAGDVQQAAEVLVDEPAFPSTESEARPASESPAEVHPLSHDVLMVVAANGGWNPMAMRRLAMLAHARGIASSEIPAAITAVFSSPAAPVAAVPEAPDNRDRVGRVSEGVPAHHRNASLGATIAPWAFATITVVSLFLIWTRLTQKDASPIDRAAQVEQSTSAAQTQTPVAPVDPTPTTIPTEQVRIDARMGAREIVRLARLRSAIDSARIGEIGVAHDAVATRWTDLDEDQIGAVHNAILEMLYQGDQQAALRVITILGEPLAHEPGTPDELRAWVWSMGMLSRLSVERNLSTALDSAIIGRLASTQGDAKLPASKNFSDATLAALSLSGSRLVDAQASDELWRVWISMLGTVSNPDHASYSKAALDAMTHLLITSSDSAQSRSRYQALTALAGAVKLEPESPVAERLIDWLSDDRISTDSLAVAMRALVARSRIEGVDEGLILSSSASEADRLALRIKLESALLGRDQETAEAISAWMDIADQQLRRTGASRPSELVARAVILSRLSAAARATIWGDRQGAEATLANLTGDVDRLVSSVQDDAGDYLGGANAEEWALKYIDARQNIPIRQALLAELTRGNRVLGPVAAEVIVRDAFLGTPAAVRAQAREVVRLYANSPAILNAVLEYLPRIPKIDSSSELIEAVAYTRLPAASSPSWSLRARQACVDELLRRVSGLGEGQAIDLLVGQLYESYVMRLGSEAGQVSSGSDAVGLVEVAASLEEHWRRLAENEIEDMALLSQLDEWEHRRTGRLLLAEGMLERFAAHQVSEVEAMALLVMSESPSLRPEAEAVLAELGKERREAKNILEQIAACESAAVKLWRLRLRRSAS